MRTTFRDDLNFILGFIAIYNVTEV